MGRSTPICHPPAQAAIAAYTKAIRLDPTLASAYFSRGLAYGNKGEFDKEIADYTEAEHRPLSFKEWEDGFRRDANPEQQIALWSHAADVYTTFTANEPSADRRRDVYRCIVACLTTGPDSVWRVLRPDVLGRAEAEQVVDRFFGKPGK